jgi:golgi phosphoprotein 3
MLSFVEEATLLLLDDKSGEFIDMPVSGFGTVIAGAALMDLAMHDRVDTDLEKLTVVDKAAIGDSILDDALAQLSQKPEDAAGMRILEAIDRVAQKSQDYAAEALKRLVAHGILRQDSGRFLWMFHTRRYPVIDDREEQEVKARLRQILLTDEIPDPRDVVLICLVAACELMELILTQEELAKAEPRIEQLRKMDLIGQAVAKAVREIEFIFRYATSAA